MIDADHPPPVFIVEVSALGGASRKDWLCEACIAKRVAGGQQAEKCMPVERPCDDCGKTWRSPTVAFAPTSAGARLPTAEECPRPGPVEPSADRMARLRAESTVPRGARQARLRTGNEEEAA